MRKDEWYQQIIDFLNWQAFLVGLIGSLGLAMYKKIKGQLKTRLEFFYILFVGSFFAALGTEPVVWLIKHFLYEGVESNKKVMDILSFIIGASGWALFDFVVMELPGILKRWLAKQADFAAEELKRKIQNKDDDATIN